MERRTRWKLAAALVLGPALLAGVFALWIQSVADRRWKEMEARVAELLQRARSRPTARPVLRGQAVPGSAWEEYGKALSGAKAMRTADAALGNWVTRSPKADRAAVEAALTAHGSLLDLLRFGVQRAEGTYPTEWERGFFATTPEFVSAQRLGNLAVCRSRLLREEGKPREAAELVLDLAQFARDMGADAVVISEMVGIAVLRLALDELREILAEGKLSAAESAAIDRELEVLDRNFPSHGESLRGEALAFGMSLIGDPAGTLSGSGYSWSPKTWRYGFSSRLVAVDAFFTLDGLYQRIAGVKSWADATALQAALLDEVQRSPNPVLAQGRPVLRMIDAGRIALAQLRLLRVRAHHLASGEWLDLDDPFGTKLRRSNLALWSAGRDGVYGGGVGGWKPEKTGDIVLEIGP